MIVAKTVRWGTVAAYIGAPLAFLILFDFAIAFGYVFAGWTWLALPDVPLSIFGGVIGVITGFRNSSAYARWWEARTIWGAIVNSSRSFAREVLTMISVRNADWETQRAIRSAKRKLIFLQIAYVHALRNHLRGLQPWAELGELLDDEDLQRLKTFSNVPLAIQQTIATIIQDCYGKGWLDEVRWAALDRTLSVLMDCQGASERIKNTPMPRLYDMFIGLFVNLFCFLLPLGMVESLKLWTPLGSTLVGLMFLSLDRIGRVLEAPFDNTPMDVSLTAITRTIEINLRQMIEEKDVPEPVAAVDGVLW